MSGQNYLNVYRALTGIRDAITVRIVSSFPDGRNGECQGNVITLKGSPSAIQIEMLGTLFHECGHAYINGRPSIKSSLSSAEIEVVVQAYAVNLLTLILHSRQIDQLKAAYAGPSSQSYSSFSFEDSVRRELRRSKAILAQYLERLGSRNSASGAIRILQDIGSRISDPHIRDGLDSASADVNVFHYWLLANRTVTNRDVSYATDRSRFVTMTSYMTTHEVLRIAHMLPA